MGDSTTSLTRLNRLTAILTYLQSRRTITAQEISDRFEISLRTVYRDIRALQDAGVPIGAEVGVGYYMVEGYTLPPLMITEEEANALIVSEKLVEQQGDNSLKRDYQSLLTKIRSLLRSQQQENIERLDSRIDASVRKDTESSNWLSDIQKAIAHTQVLHLRYHSLYKEEITEREVQALAIYFTNQAWVMVAYCRLRKDLREFRLDRILHLYTLNETFSYDPDFDLRKYFLAHE